MKAIVLTFDSLNRHLLAPYGCDWVKTPNFRRLARRAVTFDRSYVCSMPCMPARRELHTGRPNFLHRFWGPLEPYDDSAIEMLKNAGVYTHLTTDHFHYAEDGGANYHNRYNSWELFRGQSGDLWQGQVGEPKRLPCSGRNAEPEERVRQDWVNRPFLQPEHRHSQTQTAAAGVDFIARNHGDDNWMLQVEIFDPHEPFHVPRKYKDRYAAHFDKYRAAGGKLNDWPYYRLVDETPEQVEHLRNEYAALVSMCDASLGDILDAMDEYDLWKDTLLIVWTDHGFMLGEHGMWAKNWMPFYEEISHTPFFVWDPRCGKGGQRRQSLVQPALDLPLTLLNFFGIAPTSDMLGKDLAHTIAGDAPVREAAIFGMLGGQVNVTDGRYTYHRAPVNAARQPAYEYTVTGCHVRSRMSVQRLRGATFAPPFSFTKGCPLLRVLPEERTWHDSVFESQLFDLQNDPRQFDCLNDEALEQRMTRHLVNLMRECDAPLELYERLGLASNYAANSHT